MLQASLRKLLISKSVVILARDKAAADQFACDAYGTGAGISDQT